MTSFRQGKSHNLDARIDINYVAGDAAAQIAGQKNSRVSHFRRVGITAERGQFGATFQHFRKVPNAAGRRSFDGSRRDCVYSNIRRAKVGRQVPHRSFERRFGDAHDVVIFHYPRGPQVSQRHYRPAALVRAGP